MLFDPGFQEEEIVLTSIYISLHFTFHQVILKIDVSIQDAIAMRYKS